MPSQMLFWRPDPGTWIKLGENVEITPGPVNPRIAKTAPGAPMFKVNSRSWVGPYGGTTMQVVNGRYTSTLSGGHGEDAKYEDDPNDRGPEHYRKTFLGAVTMSTYRDQVFRECIFRGDPVGTSPSSSGNAVDGHTNLGGGLGGATFIDCLFEPPGNGTWNPWAHGVAAGDFHLFRCEVSGWTDGVSLTGPFDGTTVEWSWIHNGFFATGTYGDPNTPVNSDGKTHNDGIQFHRGKNIRIENNYIGGVRNLTTPNAGDDYNNSGIMLKQEVDSALANKLENIYIRKNYFEGCQTGINIDPDKGNTGSTWWIEDNRFIPRVGSGQYIINNDFGPHYARNVNDTTGALVPVQGQPSA